ncbi:SDR family NAD(P)-dependent oxidoreductase [Beggiatoa leptomitoformis]|uniref:SDR family oxidoreductase n=1 Tax=Beggiatoa leptomitoformis TaxID=288004 RepID=A0A2N9YIC0_9GAMM|nr:SDR family oxidoreductase [Beggiatoa leptomitoformis]ALG67534.1 SDR family oxidoreductase [Beggiatoa leptomitoformis]AUI70240.1 SDR family oxidoreductase [Beggiatoa leptomitoformis]
MKKIALVTGGNSGIGHATAKLLKEKGYDVFISGRDANRLQKTANELGVTSLFADMSKPEDLQKLAIPFLETGLDVLVCNAGVAKPIPIPDIKWTDFFESFSTNVWGPIFLIKELLPALEKRQGNISIVSSVVAQTMEKSNLCLYAATKGAVNAFVCNMVTELTPKGIRINAVAPGPIDTPMFDKAGSSPEAATEFKRLLASEIPLGRIGKPEEVAHVIVAQLEATYVTGSIWTVDGGVSVV